MVFEINKKSTIAADQAPRTKQKGESTRDLQEGYPVFKTVLLRLSSKWDHGNWRWVLEWFRRVDLILCYITLRRHHATKKQARCPPKTRSSDWFMGDGASPRVWRN